MKTRCLFLIAILLMLVADPLRGQDQPPAESEKKPAGGAVDPNSKGGMVVKEYTIPHMRIGGEIEGNGSGAEPGATKSVREILEKSGVPFSDGASALFIASTGKLIVRNTPEALELVDAYLAEFLPEPEKQLFIILEMIEVNHADFTKWLLENRMERDATGLRRTVQEWVRAGQGTILETTTVMARSGQRAKVESIDEYIYPTEYDPPSVPNEVTLSDGAAAPISGVTPTAFETRNLGVTLEVDPVLNAEESAIDLNLAPERVELAGFTEWSSEKIDELFKTTQPTFHTMKTTTQVTVPDGGYVLLGTTRPLHPATPERTDALVLNFVRVDVSTAVKWTVEELAK